MAGHEMANESTDNDAWAIPFSGVKIISTLSNNVSLPLTFFFQVEHYKGENEELVRKYEKTKEELEQAIEKLNEEVNVQRSETELHVSKLQRQHTLSDQKYMEEVILSNIIFFVL